jgi:hypothetical protein
MGCTAEELGSLFCQGQEIFLFSARSRLALGPISLSSSGYRGGVGMGVVKPPGCEADYIPLFNSSVKNGRAVTSLTHMSS